MADVDREVTALVTSAVLLVLDFDGTLVDSNEIKFRAFDRCFADAGDRREEIAAYCRRGHHIPRDEKFRHVYERILGRAYTPDARERLHRAFEAATTTAIVAAPEIAGAGDFLAHAARGHVLALLSSTPHAVLETIVTARAWRDHFKVVKGAPVDKREWLLQRRGEMALASDEVVMFGDTAEDAAAAAAAGIAFVGVGEGPGLEDARWRIRDFTALRTST